MMMSIFYALHQVPEMPRDKSSKRGRQEGVSFALVEDHHAPSHEESVGSTSQGLLGIPATGESTTSDAVSTAIMHTRYIAKKGKWVAPTCENLHKDEEHVSQPNAVPPTSEQMSTNYPHPQSGIAKGIGTRSSSSLRITATSSQGPNEEVVHLERERKQRLEQLQQQMRQQFEQELEQLRQQRQQMEQKLDAAIEFVKRMGYQWPPPPPDDGSAGCGLGVT